ncbi:MAG: folate family ECF transporter S component [Clostridia bacterium]|nr:folate family ECF transporter S component [Clostridia bacterium]
MSQQKNIRRICYLALLIAMNIVFVRLLSFQTPVTRLDFGFIPLAVSGAIFGPVWGGLTAGAADILGMLINSKGMAYFFPWTLNAVLHGVLYGCFLCKKEKHWGRILCLVVVQGVVVDLLLGSLWGAIYRSGLHLYWAVFVERFVMILIKMPIQYFVLTIIFRILKPHIQEL